MFFGQEVRWKDQIIDVSSTISEEKPDYYINYLQIFGSSNQGKKSQMDKWPLRLRKKYGSMILGWTVPLNIPVNISLEFQENSFLVY